MRIIKRIIFISTILFTAAFIPQTVNRQEFPVYRVVIDPGHGGVCKMPMAKHGDRYDSISKTYLDNFRDGASWRELHEHEIVYSIGSKVEEILKLCGEGGDYHKFVEILKKYTDEIPPRVVIATMMSRGKSISLSEAGRADDPNSEYRIFDYPGKEGNIQPGRLTKINRFKPHLVMSLHLASSASYDFKGMNPVILPPHSFLKNGLMYLRKKSNNRFFYNSRYSDWFNENDKRSSFMWFLNDVSLYYTGYPLLRNLKTDLDNFKGYRYNMVGWKYRDQEGWEKIAAWRPSYTRYSMFYEDIMPSGKFWDREESAYEDFRRAEGPEGFGGDNAFASYEIIRYMLFAMRLGGYEHWSHVPGKPYISIWLVPHHVNAISSFIELGYLNRRQDRYMLVNRQNELAEGIAVGIYSLFTGLKIKKSGFKYLPKGERIDFEKYIMPNGKTYFEDSGE